MRSLLLVRTEAPPPGTGSLPDAFVAAPPLLSGHPPVPGPVFLDLAPGSDLSADLPSPVSGVLARGLVGARDLQRLGAALAVAEAERGWPDGSLAVLASAADSARGVLAVASLPGASRRLLGLVWDEAALAADLGLDEGRGRAGALVEAEAWTILAARAAGVPAYAAVRGRGDAPTRLNELRQAGFRGVLTADASLIAPANDLF